MEFTITHISCSYTSLLQAESAYSQMMTRLKSLSATSKISVSCIYINLIIFKKSIFWFFVLCFNVSSLSSNLFYMISVCTFCVHNQHNPQHPWHSNFDSRKCIAMYPNTTAESWSWVHLLLNHEGHIGHQTTRKCRDIVLKKPTGTQSSSHLP